MMRVAFWAWGLTASLWGAVTFALASGVSINVSPSMPIGIWIVRPLHGQVDRGTVISFCSIAWHQSAEHIALSEHGSCPDDTWPLLKPVAALPGDQVTVDGAGISVNGQLLPNSQRQTVAAAELIAGGHYQVAADELWVVSTLHPRSFDSRYFGPIKRDAVRGEAHPLLVSP